jgi:hypothetical protein
LNYLGEFTAAQAHLAQGIALYDPQQHRAHAFRYGRDPGVVCRYYASVTLWYLGYPDQALQTNLDTVSFTYMRSPADCVLKAHPRPPPRTADGGRREAITRQPIGQAIVSIVLES